MGKKKDPRRHKKDKRSKRRAPDLDAHIEGLIEEGLVPGVAVGVVGRDVLTVRAYGLADVEEARDLTRDHVFQLASVSKLVTAAAAAICFEEGGFGLDDDVNDHLPFSVRHPEYPRRAITPRMLMGHTSGISDSWDVLTEYYEYDGDCEVALGDFLQDYLTEDGEDFDADDNFTDAAPGEESEYSNVAVALLGYLIECVSGEPFDRYCERKIFKPLGLKSMTWRVSDVKGKRRAWPYEWDDDEEAWTSPGFYSTPDYPDGQLCATVEDMARFIRAYMGWDEQRALISAKTRRLFFSPACPDVDPDQRHVWYVNALDDVELVGHEGDEDGVQTSVWIDPARELAFLVFANGDCEDVREEINRLLVDAHAAR